MANYNWGSMPFIESADDISWGSSFLRGSGPGGAPQVASASMPDAVTVNVSFTAEMKNDAALTTATNYVFSDGPTTITASTVTRHSSTMVHVTITGEARTGSNYTVTVSNVKGLDETPIDTDHDTAVFEGLGVAPQVSSADSDSVTNKVVVTFNEDMDDGTAVYGDFTFAGPTTLTAASIIWNDDRNVEVTFTGEARTGFVNYTVTVAGTVKDMAGNGVDPAHNSATFNGRGVAPQVSSASSSTYTDRVVVVFDEPMDTSITTASHFTYDVPSGAPELSSSSMSWDDSTHARVVFTGEMRTGTANYTVKAGTGIKDVAGNGVDPLHKSATFDGNGVAPRVSSATSDSYIDRVTIAFNEAMDTSITTPGDYTFDGPAEAPLTASSVSWTNSTHAVVYFTGEAKSGTANYTVTAGSGVKDAAGNSIDPAYDDATFNGNGVKPWVASAEVISPYVVRVHFDSAMANSTGLTDKSNYSFDNEPGSDPLESQSVVAEAVTYPTYVDVTVDVIPTPGTDNYTVSVANWEISGIHDRYGNYIDSDHLTATFSGPVVEAFVDHAETHSDKVVRVYYSTGMTNNAGLVNKNYYTFAPVLGSVAITAQSVTAEATTYPTYVDVAVDKSLTIGVDNYNVEVTAYATSGIQDKDANQLDDDARDADFDGDGPLPRVLSASMAEPGVVEIVFNRDMADSAEMYDPLNFVMDDRQYVGGGSTLGVMEADEFTLVRDYTSSGHEIYLKGLYAYHSGGVDKIVVAGEDFVPATSDTMIVEHYNGTTWSQPFPHGEDGYVQCLTGKEPTELFLGGSIYLLEEDPDASDGEGYYACIFRYNGSAWSRFHIFPYEFLHVDKIVVDQYNPYVWATLINPSNAGCVVYRYDRGTSTWSDMSFDSDTGICIFSMAAAYTYNVVPPNFRTKMYFGGIEFGSPNVQRVWSWETGTGWTEEYTGTTQGEVNTVVVLRPDDIWAAGYPSKFAHWDGATWTEITAPVSGLWVMASEVPFARQPETIYAPNAVYFGGHDNDWDNRYIIRWNGAELQAVYTDTGSGTKAFFGMTGKPGVTFEKVTDAEPTDATHTLLTLDAEMLTGADYTIFVNTNLLDTSNNPIDYTYNHADLEGLGVAPQVSSVDLRDATSLELLYDSMMLENLDLVDAANYVITNPDPDNPPALPTITVESVVVDAICGGSTSMLLTLSGEMKDGATYTVTVSDVVDVVGNVIDPAANFAEFDGIGVQPNVSGATGTAWHEVRVQFDEAMKEVDALTDPDNYTFLGLGVLGAESVVYDADNHWSTVTFTGDPVHGHDNITVFVNVAITDLAENPLDVNSALFDVNDYIPPHVLSATMPDMSHVSVRFNEDMDTSREEPTDFVITGPTTPTVAGILWSDATHALLAVSEVETGESYTVTVSNVTDEDGNVVDPAHNHAHFTGLGEAPQVEVATMPDYQTVRVTFTESMKDESALTTKTNYAMSGTPTPVIDHVDVVGGSDFTEVDLTLSNELHTGGSYSVEVSNVHDIVGNLIDPAHDTATFDGLGVSPQVTDAVTQNALTVKVWFSESMLDNADLTDPDNYDITEPGGAPELTVSDVDVVAGTDNQQVLLTVNPDMVDDETYTVTVSAVVDLVGNVIDPAHNSHTFLGVPYSPKVTGAEATTAYNVRVTFDVAMENDVELTTNTNYVFTDGLTASHVTRVDSTNVDVTVNEMLDTHAYTVTVSNVHDTEAHTIVPAPGNQADFDGIGDLPQLDPDATTTNSKNFIIEFTQVVEPTEAEDEGNYALLPDLGIAAVTTVTATTFNVLTTDSQEVGTHYRIVASDIHDLVGNVIDPAHNYAEFDGSVDQPANLYLLPPDGSLDVPVRNYLRVQAVDSGTPGAGIDLDTLQVRATQNGVTYDVVADGVFNSSAFRGEITGDPDDTTDGVTVWFLPRTGHWEPDENCVVYAQVEDTSALATNHTWTIYFGSLRCFEDMEPTASPDDTRLLTTLPFPACDHVRRLMLVTCSTSTNQVAQARTVLWRSCESNLRTLLAMYLDLSYLDVVLCDRVDVITIQIAMAQYVGVVESALNELRMVARKELLVPIEQALRSADATQVVSALGAIVVMAAST